MKTIGKPHLNRLVAFTWIDWANLDLSNLSGLSRKFQKAVLTLTDNQLFVGWDKTAPAFLRALEIPFKDIPLHFNDPQPARTDVFQWVLKYRLKEGR